MFCGFFFFCGFLAQPPNMRAIGLCCGLSRHLEHSTSNCAYCLGIMFMMGLFCFLLLYWAKNFLKSFLILIAFINIILCQMQILVAHLNHLYIARCSHQFVLFFPRQMLVSGTTTLVTDRSIISGTRRCWAFFKNMRS